MSETRDCDRRLLPLTTTTENVTVSAPVSENTHEVTKADQAVSSTVSA